MSIRRRLVLAFVPILLLFAVNLSVYFWSTALRNRAMEDLRQAVSRQILITAIKQDLSDVQKQIALLSDLMTEAGGATPDAVMQFQAQLDKISKEIRELEAARVRNLGAEAEELKEFTENYRKLSDSWVRFYDNFGRNQTAAVTELAVRAEPLGQRVIQEMVPHIQQEEQDRVENLRAKFYSVARITNSITVAIFSLSMVLAIWLAYSFTRYLSQGLDNLQQGIEAFGGGNLLHRIDVSRKDEFGDLAGSFNNMAESLDLARQHLVQVNDELGTKNREVEEQTKISDHLLLNILPAQVARELKEKGTVDPTYFEDVTILFTDFKGFTLATEKLAAEELVNLLHDYFTAFDEIMSRYQLEKLKTIGDSYMCVAGMPARSPSHPVDAVMAAFEMVKAVTDRDRPDGETHWQVRIGLHTGPVVAGVVGIRKFAFDVWGDTVNFASRMESSGVPNQINISPATYLRVKDFIECESRGKVQTKEKREFDMYLAKTILPSLTQGMQPPAEGAVHLPPPAFLRRYRTYFQKEPPSFPGFLLHQTPRPEAAVTIP